MINERKVKKVCKDDISKIENYDKAIADTTQTWHCHHRLETHKYKDRNRNEWIKRDETVNREYLKLFGVYYDRPACEFIFLTPDEHRRIHTHSEESKRKTSASVSGEKNGFYGRHHTEETRARMSESAKKRPPVSDEVRKRMSERMKGNQYLKGHKHTEETRKKMSGLVYWNNGSVVKRSRECPGEGWVRGRIKHN